MGKKDTNTKTIKEVVDFGEDDYKFNRNLEELIGTKRNRLTLVTEVAIHYSEGIRCGMFVCDCNQVMFTSISSWKSGASKSFGCLQQETVSGNTLKHGMSKDPMYKTYMGMMGRCNNPNHADYHLYGGRGMTVCERWLEGFENFLEDMGNKIDSGLKVPTLERLDVNKGYSPDNCVWLEKSEQSVNRRRPCKKGESPNYEVKHRGYIRRKEREKVLEGAE